MTALAELNTYIQDATVMYRKGAAITHKQVGGVEVIEVFGYPETPSRGELVDVHFVNVGFTELAAYPKELAGLVRAVIDAKGGAFGEPLTWDLLAGGPSYITLGGILGSQDLALRYIALGPHFGLWNAITPATLRITDQEQADQMAGAGFVMAGPYNPAKNA